MPAASAWMVRVSFLYLAVGFVVGAAMMVDLIGRGAFRVMHGEWLLIGFMLQFAFGVASWILPRTPKRKSMTPVWMVLALVNAGVLLATVSSALGHGQCLAVGRLVIVAGAITFGIYIWPRVRSFKEKMVR